MAAEYIRAWLQQSNNTLLPVLVIKDGGANTATICVKCACQQLTPQIEGRLQYEAPRPKPTPPSPLRRGCREWDNRERLIWDSASADGLLQLNNMGQKPPSNKAAIRLQRALTNHEAKTQREAAKAAQQAEKERRQIIRQERAKLRAEREAAAEKSPRKVRAVEKAQSEPAVMEPAPTPEPTPKPKPELKIEPVPNLIDFKIEALIKQIQEQRSAVAA